MRKSLTEDFEIDGGMREWARARLPRLDIDHHHEQFMNHFLGNGKPMADWRRTWMNWMLRTMEGVYGTKPKLKPIEQTLEAFSQDPNCPKAATLLQAEIRNIKTAGKTEKQLNHAIWEHDQS